MREGAGKPEVNPAPCEGCGACVAARPTYSMQQNLFADEKIEGVLAHV
ncbi:MAG: hypothetical protein ABSD56_06505 [Bryobacteraceae bacterium]